VPPLTGKPQEVILAKIPSDTWDVFVGVLWMRFGSPSGSVSPNSGQAYESATEEEFELAYSLWKQYKRPRIMIYRCVKPPERMDAVDAVQFKQVSDFFNRFTVDGQNPGLFKSFSDWGEFELELEQDLSRNLKEMANHRLDESLPSSSRDEAILGVEDRGIDKLLEVGHVYQVGFISIDIARHSSLVRNNRDHSDDIRALLSNFKSFVLKIARERGGVLFSWAVDGGLLIFWGERYKERTILTGIKLQHEMSMFNLDVDQNPVGDALSVRVAANSALILFQLPTSSISSVDLNYTVHLQERCTQPGELCITDTLLSEVEKRIASLFVFKVRFEGKPVFSYRQPVSEVGPTKESMEALRVVSLESALTMRVALRENSDLTDEVSESLSSSLDKFYSSLEKFCSWFSSVDDRWSVVYLLDVEDFVGFLLKEEASAWDDLRQRYLGYGKGSDTKEYKELEAIVHSASSRRSRPVVFLERLRIDLERRARGSAQAPGGQIAATARIRDLVAADELEQEVVLTDILLNYKDFLCEYLVHRHEASDYRALLDSLWASADLLLIDELYSLRSYLRKTDKKVTVILTDDPVRDQRFGILRTLLERANISDEDVNEWVMKLASGEVAEVREVIWRCLLVGHTSTDTKRLAADNLSESSIWQMVSRSRMPIDSLYCIGMRLKKGEEELKKIYFDCVRARLLHEVQAATGRGEVADLTKIILLLIDFDFIVETVYFNRFDEILTHFLSTVEKMGLRIDYFERLRSKINMGRQERGLPDGSVPKGVRKFPLAIQRRLAGEAPYLMWFISHPDPRVALETLRHIGLANLELVLRVSEVNGQLMRELLRKGELFTKRTLILLALNHPKCTVEFGKQQIANLMNREGHKLVAAIARSVSANPAVRAIAKSALASAVSRWK
jgi:hypothetical protein